MFNKPSLYDRVNQLQMQNAQKLLKSHQHVMQWREHGGDSLLDVGTGSGNVLMDLVRPWMPKNFSLIVGIDISSDMIEFCRRKYVEHGDRVRFEVCDIASRQQVNFLNYANKFDHITSFSCLHWVTDQRAALENIYAMLRPSTGDFLLFFMLDHDIIRAFRQLSDAPKWLSYLQHGNESLSVLHQAEDPCLEYRRLLQEAGFVDYNVQLLSNVHRLENAEQLKEFLEAVCPYLKNDSPELLAEFLKEAFDIVAADYKVDKNEQNCDFSLPFTYLSVYAKK